MVRHHQLYKQTDAELKKPLSEAPVEKGHAPVARQEPLISRSPRAQHPQPGHRGLGARHNHLPRSGGDHCDENQTLFPLFGGVGVGDERDREGKGVWGKGGNPRKSEKGIRKSFSPRMDKGSPPWRRGRVKPQFSGKSVAGRGGFQFPGRPVGKADAPLGSNCNISAMVCSSAFLGPQFSRPSIIMTRQVEHLALPPQRWA